MNGSDDAAAAADLLAADPCRAPPRRAGDRLAPRRGRHPPLHLPRTRRALAPHGQRAGGAAASASATASPRWPGTATATWSCTTRCRGSGAVLHTLNPRLHPDQVVWIADHAEDQVLFFDLTFLPLVEAIAARVKTIKAFVAMTDRAHMPAHSKVPEPAVLRGADRRRQRPTSTGRVRREHRLVAVLHVGHHRQPEGRALQPPLDAAAHLRGGAARRAELLGARRRSCRWCRCSTSTPGACRTSACMVGAKLVFPGPVARRQVAARAVRERGRHRVGRRADGLAGPAGARRSQRPEVQHDAPHDHRRLGLPAGDDARLPGALRRAGAARLGHDRDEPARHGVHAQAQAPGAGRRGSAWRCRPSRAARCSAST